MPVVTVGGEKKKVACGPCIRGHRSSKCAHKDRVLIEVRKPGRPLGTCPHPTGSCGCERVVINYMIPKDRASPALLQGLSPASAASSRVQKTSNAARSVANLPQSTVDKVLSGDTSALAVLSQYPSETISSSSDTSSLPPSASSSASATPRIDALQSGPNLKSLPQIDDQPTINHVQHDASPLQRPLLAKKKQPAADSPADLPSQAKSCCCSQPADAPENPATPLPTTNPSQSTTANQSQDSPSHPSFPNLSSSNQDYTHQSMTYDFAGVDALSATDFPSFEFEIGCGGMQPPANSISQRMMAHEAVDCSCGDTCPCFACMTHPRNRTTVDYVRYHNELLSQASYIHPQYGQPTVLQNQRPVYDASHQYNMSTPTMGSHPLASQVPQHDSSIPQQHLEWAASQSHSAQHAIPHTPVSELENLHFPLYSDMYSPALMTTQSPSISTQTFDHVDLGHQVYSTPSLNFNPQMTVRESHRTIPKPLFTSLFEADSPRDEDASTLSPSSFSLQQFTVPGCNDMTGTCQCGEGCSCPGCLTHSGHDHKTCHTTATAPDTRAQDLIAIKAEKKSCCS